MMSDDKSEPLEIARNVAIKALNEFHGKFEKKEKVCRRCCTLSNEMTIARAFAPAYTSIAELEAENKMLKQLAKAEAMAAVQVASSDTDKPKQPDLITALAQYKDDLALFHGPPKIYVQGRVDGFADGYNAGKASAEQPDTDKLKAHACAFAEYVTGFPLVKHSYTNFMAKIEESE